MTGNSFSFVKLLYLISLTPRGQRLSLRIANARKKIVFEDKEYLPFPFLAAPQEREGKIVNFEVEFARNRHVLQGVPLYKLDKAEVRVRIVPEDRPTQVLQSYRGTFAMHIGKMWITRLQQDFNPSWCEVLGVLRWNDQPPTRPGWYWLSVEDNPGGDREAIVVKVVKGKFGLEAYFVGTEVTKPLKAIAMSCKWSGPIPAPAES